MAREETTNGEITEQKACLPAWAFIAVAAVAVFVYVNTLGNGFVFDDIPVVLENPNIRGFSKIPRIFTSSYGEGTQLGFTALYRPLVILSLAANYQAGSLSPWHYHLVNTLLHAVNALLVLLLALRLSRSKFIAIAAGLIFALHPVNTEAVSPVVGRTDLLGTFFVLCSLILYAKYSSAGKRKTLLLIGSFACLAGGLLSKEHAVVVPGLIMLWDFVKRDGGFKEFLRNLPRRLLYPYSGFIGLVAAYLLVRYAVVGSLGVGATISVIDNPLMELGQPQRFLTAAKVSVAYFFRLIAPVTLAHDYSYPQIPPASVTESLAALFVLAMFTWALIYSYMKNRLVFYGLAFFAIGFSIVSNLVFIIGTIMAERLLYLPGIGFAIAAGALLEAGRQYLSKKKNPKLAMASAAALLGIICILFAVRTVIRTFNWRSQLTIYQQAVRAVPYNSKVRMGYGQTLSEHHDYDKALEEFGKALALLGPERDAKFPYVVADVLFDTANILKKQGLYIKAIAKYEEALALWGGRPEFLFNYGHALFMSRRFAEALNIYTVYLEKGPEYHEAHNALGLIREALGEYGAAEKSYLKSIELHPEYPQPHKNLGLLHTKKLNQPEKAIKHLELYLKYAPKDVRTSSDPDMQKIEEALRRYRRQKGESP